MTLPDPQATTQIPFRPAGHAENAETTSLLRAGYVRRVAADVYVAADVPDSIELRARAALLMVPDRLLAAGGVLGFAAACWVHSGWSLAPGHLLSTFDVLMPPRVSRAGTDFVRVRQVRIGPEGAASVHGLPLTTAARTAADVARDLPDPLALSALNALRAACGVDPDAVRATLELMINARGARRARGVVEEWAQSSEERFPVTR